MCTVVLFLLLTVTAFCQTGPGGIGDRTGTSTLEAWFEARDLDGDDVFSDNPANGTSVSGWTDKSGNANNLSQGTSGNQPTYTTSGTYNAVDFVNTGSVATLDYMSFASALHLIPGSAYFVLLPTDAGFAANTLMDDANRSLRMEQYNNTNFVGYTRYGVADYTSTLNPNYGAYTILGFLKSNANNTLNIRQNNGAANVNIGSSTNGIPLTRLGATVAADGANYQCVEIIAYSAYLNTAQIRIMENYLSAKYGGISITNDQYTMDNGGLDFDYDVAGIGRTTSAANSHSDSQSDILRISGPSDLTNNEFLYFGHDNGVAEGTEFTDVPSPVQVRLGRVWAANEVGEVGTVTIRVDLTGLGSVTTSDLRLLIDTDGDGVFNEGSTTISGSATSLGSNIYQWTGIDIDDQNRFTIGSINSVQTPLPVELVSFEATVNNDKVILSWATASELNNDYFTIERSNDGRFFYETARQEGNGTSVEFHTYQWVDHDVPQGRYYYRLTQTDYDGTWKHIGLLTVTIKPGVTGRAFPNPVRRGEWLYIPGYGENRIHYELIDAKGRIVTMTTESDAQGGTRALVPLDLAPGTYWLKGFWSGATSVTAIIIE